MEFLFTHVDHKKDHIKNVPNAFKKTVRINMTLNGILTQCFMNARSVTHKDGTTSPNIFKDAIDNGYDFQTWCSPFALWGLYGLDYSYDDIESKPYMSYSRSYDAWCVEVQSLEELLELMEKVDNPIIIGHPNFEDEHRFEARVWDGFLSY